MAAGDRLGQSGPKLFIDQLCRQIWPMLGVCWSCHHSMPCHWTSLQVSTKLRVENYDVGSILYLLPLPWLSCLCWACSGQIPATPPPMTLMQAWLLTNITMRWKKILIWAAGWQLNVFLGFEPTHSDWNWLKWYVPLKTIMIIVMIVHRMGKNWLQHVELLASMTPYGTSMFGTQSG